jgi:hypothetical protein
MLASERQTPKEWWLMVKPHVRRMQAEDGVISVDDSIVEKPYTDENETICWHYDHSKGRTIKGINFVTALYESKGITVPVNYHLIAKTEEYTNKKGQLKRRSPTTKNEHYRQMLKTCVQNQIPFNYVLNDIWFASAENMRFVKLDLDKEFIMALKANRKVALSTEDKQNGHYQRLDSLELAEETLTTIYLEGISFPLHLLRQVFTNKDGSVGVRYLVTSDLSLTVDQLPTIFKRRWKVEEYHRSLKQNASVAQSPTRTRTTQTNHFVASLWSFTKLELLKVRTKKNHYALKSQLYLTALRQAFDALSALQPVRLAHLCA